MLLKVGCIEDLKFGPFGFKELYGHATDNKLGLLQGSTTDIQYSTLMFHN